MICLSLFLNFFMIGALSFGGGYGMISLVREVVLGHGWLTEAEFLSFIAVSESTPGPLAVNMATFIGSSQGGFFGALCATLGVVLPSFFIILLIAAALRGLMKYAGMEALLSGGVGNVLSIVKNLAVAGLQKTQQDTTQRGLAAAGFADDAERLASGDVKADAIDRMEHTGRSAEVFFEIADFNQLTHLLSPPSVS